MGWERKVKRTHECKKPNPPLRRGIGSIWRCRRCDKRWVLIINRTDGYYHTWRWVDA